LISSGSSSSASVIASSMPFSAFSSTTSVLHYK
jgi:hypothetical protein